MKITRARLKEIIREELQKVVEASAEEHAEHLTTASRKELGLTQAPSAVKAAAAGAAGAAEEEAS